MSIFGVKVATFACFHPINRLLCSFGDRLWRDLRLGTHKSTRRAIGFAAALRDWALAQRPKGDRSYDGKYEYDDNEVKEAHAKS